MGDWREKHLEECAGLRNSFDRQLDLDSIETEEFQPAHMNRDSLTHAQISLFPGAAGRYANKSSMGTFFEVLAASLYGGTHFNARVFEDNHLRPDVYDFNRNRFLEAKACMINSRQVMRDGQLFGYRSLQLSDLSARIRTVVFRHCFAGIGKFGKASGKRHMPYEEMVAALTNNPFAVLSVDFVLTDLLHDQPDSNTWLKRYPPAGTLRGFRIDAEKPFERCTYMPNRTVNALIQDPLLVVEQLGINPDRVDVRHYRTPPGMVLDGIVVPPLFITHIDMQDREELLAARFDHWQTLYEQYFDGMWQEAQMYANMHLDARAQRGEIITDPMRLNAAIETISKWDAQFASLFDEYPDMRPVLEKKRAELPALRH